MIPPSAHRMLMILIIDRPRRSPHVHRAPCAPMPAPLLLRAGRGHAPRSTLSPRGARTRSARRRRPRATATRVCDDACRMPVSHALSRDV